MKTVVTKIILTYEAFRVTEENALEAAVFVGGEVWKIDGQSMVVRLTPEGRLLALPGDVLVQDSDGSVDVLNEAQFAKTYQYGAIF